MIATAPAARPSPALLHRATTEMALLDPRSKPAREFFSAVSKDAAGTSYFVSPGWIDNWLATVPPTCATQQACFSAAGEPLATCFLSRRTIRRHLLFTSRAVFLNETGDPHFDQLCIEHNDVVRRSGVCISGDDLVRALSPKTQEFFLSGIRADADLLSVSPPYECIILRCKPSPYVDLRKVRERADYLALLSSSTRAQIRRSYRLYEEKHGAIAVQCAASGEEALDFFDEMVSLHRQHWYKKGSDGAFNNPFMLAFHRSLIGSRFDRGEIQMLRVAAGATTIGFLYNFLLNGVISFYQSGFRYSEDNRLKPGLVAHTEAIRYNASAGHNIYDFLAGESRYKASLSTDSTELVWAVIRKPLLKFKVEDRLCLMKRAAVRLFSRLHGTKLVSALEENCA